MTEMVTMTRCEKERLEERARKCAMDKSYLQLVLALIQRMSVVPGLDNFVENMLLSIAEVIGAVNIILYYWVDDGFCVADVFGKKQKLDAIDDPLVHQVFETHEPLEIEHPFRDSKMTTPEFGKAYTWVFPLLVQPDLIGIIKLERLHIGMRDLYKYLPTFFHYAAMVLKNEIRSEARLQKAFDELSREVIARKDAERALLNANAELETKVTERTAELLDACNRLAIDIQERTRTEETLRINEQNLRSWFNTIPESVFLIDSKGLLLAANGAFAARLGQTVATCVGKSIYSLIPGENAAERQLRVEEVCRTKSQVVFEDWRGDLLLHHYLNPILDDTGEVVRIAGYAIDITSQREAREALRAQYDLALQLVETVEIEDCLRLCLDTAIRISGLECGGIYLLNAATGHLQLNCHRGLSDEFIRESHRYDADTPNARIVKAGKAIYTKYRDAVVEKPVPDEGLRALAVVPILHDGQPIACLNLSSRRIEEVSESTRLLLESVALQMGAFLSRVMLHANLKTSEQRFRSLFENHNAVQLLMDPGTGRILDANQAAADFYGYSAAQLRGMRTTDINTLPADEIMRRMTQIISRERNAFSFQHRLADGSLRDVDVYSCPIESGAGIILHSIVHDVTERKRAEEELRITRDYLENLINYANAPIIVWNPDFEITRFNHAFERLSGYAAEEVTGKHLNLLFPPQERTSTMLKLMETLTGQQWDSVEIPILRKDGQVRIALWNSANLYSADSTTIEATIAQGQDITERKKAEQQLRENEGRLRTITESVKDAIISIDAEGNISYWNSSAEGMFGYRKEEVFGRNVHAILAPQRYEKAFMESFPRFQREGKGDAVGKTLELTGCKKNRDEFPIELSLSAIEVEGRWNAVGVIRDISERKRVEEERANLQAQLNQSQKMEAIGQLAGGVAHDFNNLLQVIQGYSETVQMSLDADSAEWEGLEEVLGATNRASVLTRQLLAFSRRQVIEPVRTDMNELIQGVLKMLRRVIGEHIDIRFLPCAASGAVWVDKGQMEQVLMNLCVNARDAMARGGKLSITTDVLAMDAEYCRRNPWANPGSYCLVSVSDTGHGMDAATCARVFEPFFTTKELAGEPGWGWPRSTVSCGNTTDLSRLKVRRRLERPSRSISPLSRGLRTRRRCPRSRRSGVGRKPFSSAKTRRPSWSFQQNCCATQDMWFSWRVTALKPFESSR